ncbi:TetR/AcrR family transcriptional regulator [Nocardia sp. NPDC058705]|uniref:TetR/AcrR family transcriptional regulator n=1 Tax=Nocardia sp. NPDC058705 TaxID=3346609 RepID=UPI0036D13D01
MSELLEDDPLSDPVAATGDTAQRLLDAAVVLFSDKGFEATRTRDITAKAGLSPAAMYVYFASKEKVLFRLVEHAVANTLTIIEAAVAPHDEPVDRIRALVTAFSVLHARSYRRARIAQYESRHLAPEHHDIVGAIRRRIRQAAVAEVRAGIERGVFTIADPRVAVLAMMSLGIDICRWYRPGGEFTPEELGDINAELVLRILRAPGY